VLPTHLDSQDDLASRFPVFGGVVLMSLVAPWRPGSLSKGGATATYLPLITFERIFAALAAEMSTLAT
jgi:hypothetical protein